MKWNLAFLLSVICTFAYTNTISTPSNWLTYQNKQYGFIFAYPSNFVLKPGAFDTSYLIDGSWRYKNNNAVGKGLPIVSVSSMNMVNKNYYPSYFFAQMRIGVGTGSIALHACLTGQGMSGKTIINGQVFTVFKNTDVGMMQYVQVMSYRTVHKNQCIAIELVKAGSQYKDNEDIRDISDQTLNDYYTALTPVLNSFQFTGS